MPTLYFDTVTLLDTGVRIGDGETRGFDELGSGSVRLHARDLTIQGAPKDRSLTLVADTLRCNAPTALHMAPVRCTVSITAQTIVGQLSIVCTGRKGDTGAKSTVKGTPAVVSIDAEVKPPVHTLEVPAGPGGQGGAGGKGGPGGSVTIRFVTATHTPQASAPGGEGGDGGEGGPGGEGGRFKDGPKGPQGPRGPRGDAGTVDVRQETSVVTFWAQWTADNRTSGRPEKWLAHRLKVGEYFYRLGTPESLASARQHLETVLARPLGGTARVQMLLKQLRENVTFGGLPRDLDVTPDVAFVAQDNDTLYLTAQGALGHAQTIAGVAEVQATFASVLRNQALQGENTAKAAALRVDEAVQGLKVATTQTDIARGRVKNLDVKVKELRDAIQKEQESPGTLAQLGQIVELGVAIGGAAIAVSTGVGAVAAVGAGFVAIQNAQQAAQSMSEVVHDIKECLKRDDMKKFKTGLKDLKDAGKSVYDLGKLVAELDGIKATHPNPKMREISELQRERVLLEREVGLNIQMEKEADVGRQAAVAERGAILDNVALQRELARQIEQAGKAQSDPVLKALLVSVRQLLDELSSRVFLTLRAREIYLGLDATETVRHDLGHLHPDREALIEPRRLVKELAAPVADRALQMIRWSSLVDEMTSPGSLSRTPIPFWFTSDDPAVLAPLKQTGKLGFYVPIEALLEEDGSQIFEARLDSATVILHGAKIKQGSGQSLRLAQLGRWSMRRRDGVIKAFALPPREVHLAAKQNGAAVECELARPFNERAQPPYSIWGRGVAGDWEIADQGGIDLGSVTKVEVGFMSQALSGQSLRVQAAGALRSLRPLPGWPPAAVPPRPREPSTYGYGRGFGGVAAVGVDLV